MRIVQILSAAALIGVVAVSAPSAAPPAGKAGAPSRFIGAAKCKNCHGDAKTGDQYGAWMKSKHANAFPTLATPDALKFGKERGVDEPQKSEKCLKCHETGFGEAADRFMKGFEPKDGVQCETCHGPGEAHMKARMMAAASAGDDASAEPQKVPAGEIVAAPEMKQCLTCHNKESPSFKPFCFRKRMEENSHLDPRKKRTPEQIDAMRHCDCDDCKAAGKK